MHEEEEEFTIEEMLDEIGDIDLDTVVNKPPHYGDGEIECIDYMKDNLL